jgi:hypothetical protein
MSTVELMEEIRQGRRGYAGRRAEQCGEQQADRRDEARPTL